MTDKEMIKIEDLAREIKSLKPYLYLIDYGYGFQFILFKIF